MKSFIDLYLSACQYYQSPVLSHIVSPPLESDRHLYIELDKLVRDGDWSPLLRALKETRDLEHLIVFSNEKKPVKIEMGHRFTKSKTSPQQFSLLRIFPQLMSLTRDILLYSPYLVRLELAGVQIQPQMLQVLAQGLFKNDRLNEVSFARSKIGDSVLAPSLRTIMHLKLLDLSGCELTSKGAAIAAQFLKSLAVQRQADQWQYSLRQSPMDIADRNLPTHDKPQALKRLNLCCNFIGDEGLSLLLDLIREQVGLLGLDLQLNGITERMAPQIIDALSFNTTMILLDLRNNKLEYATLLTIHQSLAVNEKQRLEVMHWLSMDPMQASYHFSVQKRHRMHTKSSIKKKVSRNITGVGHDPLPLAIQALVAAQTPFVTPLLPEQTHYALESQFLSKGVKSVPMVDNTQNYKSVHDKTLDQRQDTVLDQKTIQSKIQQLEKHLLHQSSLPSKTDVPQKEMVQKHPDLPSKTDAQQKKTLTDKNKQKKRIAWSDQPKVFQFKDVQWRQPKSVIKVPLPQQQDDTKNLAFLNAQTDKLQQHVNHLIDNLSFEPKTSRPPTDLDLNLNELTVNFRPSLEAASEKQQMNARQRNIRAV
ncbi:hypothetical protein EDD86DRAFT_249568 [Gorgonomyces haynaldii]|nr:hypothetical protein EDD86DRAFT_249568 [Gorgonomyces haynaldii]